MHALDTAPFVIRMTAGAGAAAMTWLVATDLGSALARRWFSSIDRPAVVGAALGYALIGSGVGVLGFLHVLDTRVIAALLAAAMLYRVRTYWTGVRDVARRLPAWLRQFREASFLTKIRFGAIALAFGIAFVAAALPAVWWDPIAYHLPIVASVLRWHTLAFDPDIAQTGFPLLAESAALPAYALAGSAGAAMATLGAGVVLALLCGTLAESIVQGAGTLATALVATGSLWLWLAPSAYIDVTFALFAVAALAIPILPTRLVLPNAGLVSGAFAGAAAATKYPGLFVALLALVFVVGFGARRGPAAAGFITGFILLALGWYARSFMLTGDPVFPFLSATLSHLHQGSQGQQSIVDWYHRVQPHFCGGGATLSDLIQLPWRMLTNPRMFCGDPGYALRLGFVLFVAGLILCRRLHSVAIAVAALTIFWFYTAQQWRLLMDAVALFALVVAAATMLITQARRIVEGLLLALCVGGALTQLLPSTIADASNSLVPAYHYIAGTQSAQDYLRDRLETYAAAEWLGQHHKDAKIFALDDVRDYYFGPNVAWGNSPYPGGRRLDWNATPQQRYQGLRAAGYHYMVVNENPAYTHRTVIDVDWHALEGDERAGVLRRAFAANDVIVYEIQM